jgi:hypothetical protein
LTDQAVARPDFGRAALRAAQAVLRFLGAGHFGLLLVVWIVFAFVARPALMAAHAGAVDGISIWLRDRLDPRGLATFTGLAQWSSLAGLVVLVVLSHVRLAASASHLLVPAASRFLLGAAYALALCVGYAVFVWTPATAVSLMLHDTFVFFDAIHRIDAGQTPSVDFPTPLGAAMLYLPWLGSKIAGGYAGSIEIASAMVALCLCLACAQASANRHPGVVSAVLIAAVFLIVTPAVLEGFFASDSRTFEAGKFTGISEEYSLAMFYNRWGWGALIAMFAFLTPRQDGNKPPIAEVVTLGLILTFLFWLKLSYFLVGTAAACLYAFMGARGWRTLAFGGAVAGAGILGVALLTGNLFAYVGDTLFTARVSGSRISGLVQLIMDNLLELLIACSPILLMGLSGKLRRMDVWVTAVIVLGTLFIINQNAQTSGLPTLLVAAAHAIWRLKDDENRTLRLVAGLSFAALAMHTLIDRSMGLLGQTVMARREEARPAPSWASVPALRHFYAREREDLLSVAMSARTAEERRAAFLDAGAFSRKQYLRAGEYMAALLAGMKELQPVMQPSESVVVMDFASPLGFMMNARPAKGYWITFNEGRTISASIAPAPESLFADADHVMMPKVYIDPETAPTMKHLYSSFLDGAYEQRVESAYWVRWSRRSTPAE